MSRHVLNVDIDVPHAHHFHASIDIVDLASLTIVDFKLPRMMMRRAARHLGDGNDGFALSIVTAGQFGSTQANRDMTMHTGGAVLMSSRLASDLACHHDGRFWGVKLARAWFEQRQLACPDDAPVGFRASAALKLLVRYADGVLACHRAGEPLDIDLANTHLSDLIHAALQAPNADEASGEDVLVRARFTAIVDAIGANATAPDFSLAVLAGQLRMSERTIQALLARHQTSFSELLRAQRLELARKLIVNGSVAKVATAAFEAGFRDLSTFNRAFRKQFGVRPRDLKARGDGGP